MFNTIQAKFSHLDLSSIVWEGKKLFASSRLCSLTDYLHHRNISFLPVFHIFFCCRSLTPRPVPLSPLIHHVSGVDKDRERRRLGGDKRPSCPAIDRLHSIEFNARLPPCFSTPVWQNKLICSNSVTSPFASVRPSRGPPRWTHLLNKHLIRIN